jgi:hypothetical protein
MKKIILALGVLLLMVSSVSAVLGTYCGLNAPADPNDQICYPDNDAVAYATLPSTVCNQNCTMPVGVYGSPASMVSGCNCVSSLNKTRAYWQFANLSVIPNDVVFKCISLWNEYSVPYPIALYRFYDNTWNENTLNWETQPISCDDTLNECDNSDYILSNWDVHLPVASTPAYSVYTWNLSAHNAYQGLSDVDPLNINLMLRWTNSSYTSYFPLYPYPNGYAVVPFGVINPYCWIDTNGIVLNASVVNVYPLVNGNLQDGVKVCVGQTIHYVGYDTEVYSCKYTVNGVATFTEYYGDYNVNASYCGGVYTYGLVSVGTSTVNLYPPIVPTDPDCITYDDGSVPSVGGTVLWTNGTTVANATVSVWSCSAWGVCPAFTTMPYRTVMTNGVGYYNITNIVHGIYTARANKGTIYSINTESWTCAGSDSANFWLNATTNRYSYQARVLYNGLPVNHAVVKLFGDSQSYTGLSNASGIVVIPNILSGYYNGQAEIPTAEGILYVQHPDLNIQSNLVDSDYTGGERVDFTHTTLEVQTKKYSMFPSSVVMLDGVDVSVYWCKLVNTRVNYDDMQDAYENGGECTQYGQMQTTGVALSGHTFFDFTTTLIPKRLLIVAKYGDYSVYEEKDIVSNYTIAVLTFIETTEEYNYTFYVYSENNFTEPIENAYVEATINRGGGVWEHKADFTDSKGFWNISLTYNPMMINTLTSKGDTYYPTSKNFYTFEGINMPWQELDIPLKPKFGTNTTVPTQYWNISGSVISSNTSLPIRSLNINLICYIPGDLPYGINSRKIERSIPTSSNGSYSFSNLPDGVYCYVTTGTNTLYETQSRYIPDLYQNEVINFSLNLKQEYPLIGYITDCKTGVGLASIIDWTLLTSPIVVGTFTSEEPDGYLSWTAEKNGNYSFKINLRDYASVTVTYSTPFTQPLTRCLTPVSKYYLKGTVKSVSFDTNGNEVQVPLTNAAVHLTDSLGTTYDDETSGSYGYFSFGSLNSGIDYAIYASYRGNSSRTITIPLDKDYSYSDIILKIYMETPPIYISPTTTVTFPPGEDPLSFLNISHSWTPEEEMAWLRVYTFPFFMFLFVAFVITAVRKALRQ